MRGIGWTVHSATKGRSRVKSISSKLTYANVMATIAVFIAIGGSAYAATQLKKNSVGTRQLKKNSVVTSKIKNGSVTGTKIQTNSLTGSQVNASTLGTVPGAQVANSIIAPEDWHEVGKPGQPEIQNGWGNSPLPEAESVAFYKDQEGVVHLRGFVVNLGGGRPSETIFQLPTGYRPANGKELVFPVWCYCNIRGQQSFTGPLAIFGTGTATGGGEGDVLAGGATLIWLDGITFRAES